MPRSETSHGRKRIEYISLFLISNAFLYLIFQNYLQNVNKAELLGLKEFLGGSVTCPRSQSWLGEEQGLGHLSLPARVGGTGHTGHDSWENLLCF